MSSGLTRATFNRSALVRVLSDSVAAMPDPKYDLGERLAQWLDFSDALTLFSVLNTENSNTTSANYPAHSDLSTQLAQLRRNLGDSIRHDGVFTMAPAGSSVRIPLPTPLPDTTAESAADFSPYHRYYLAHQRDMNTAITALRTNARKALSSQSATGKRLADIDTAFEKFLLTRERKLMANIPILLGKRFNQHYAEHRAALDNDQADDPATWTQPGSWLEAFCHDTQMVLIAELELRLKPVAGLIAALTAIPGAAPETNENLSQ